MGNLREMQRSRRKSNISNRVKQTECNRLVAIDTETTGLDLRHDCKPFIVSTCTEQGEVKVWVWSVDPTTRQPSIPHKDKVEIAEFLRDATLVGHNLKFDFRALASIGFRLWFFDDEFEVPAVVSPGYGHVAIHCKTYHDTLFASHACSSGDSHGLKDLAVKYLGYSDADESELKELVGQATRYCKSRDIKVSLGKSPNGKRQTGYDYWLPAFVADHICKELVEVETERLSLSQERVKSSRTLKRLEKLNKQSRELYFLEIRMRECCETYAGKDVERTMLLWQFYQPILDDLGVRPAYERERVLMQTVYKTETGGISINQKLMTRKKRSLEMKAATLERSALAFCKRRMKRDINLASPKDLGELLYKNLKMEVKKKTPKGAASLDKDAIEKMLEDVSHKDSPRYSKSTTKFFQDLLLSRSYFKGAESCDTCSAYGINSTQHRGYSTLYPNLNQTGTGTTRFSSSSPNGQNISKIAVVKIGRDELPGPRIRDVFSPLPGKIWYDIDYNQLELRIFAYCSGEQSLIKALADGYDFHEYVACCIFNKQPDQITKQERRISKNTNFSIIFGGSPWKVDLTAGMNGAYEMFSGQFPSVQPYMQEVIAKVRETGYVETLDGYRLDVPPDAPYKGVSYRVQGTAGSIIKNAMIKIAQRKRVDWKHSRLVLQVHDELIVEHSISHRTHNPAFVRSIMDDMEEAGSELGVLTPVSCDVVETDWGHGVPSIVTKTRIKAA